MGTWIERSAVILAVMFLLGLTTAHEVIAASQRSQTVALHIDGMTCGACVKDVKAALTKVAGVSSVEITVGKKWGFLSNYADAGALVTYDPEKAGVEMLVKAVEAASNPLSAYKARVLQAR